MTTVQPDVLSDHERSRILEALGAVHDPCSVAAGRPVSIVDFGLVSDVALAAGRELHVTLRSTFPGCTLIPHFAQAAEELLTGLAGFSRVRVDIDPAFTWTPQAMTEVGRRTYQLSATSFDAQQGPSKGDTE